MVPRKLMFHNSFSAFNQFSKSTVQLSLLVFFFTIPNP